MGFVDMVPAVLFVVAASWKVLGSPELKLTILNISDLSQFFCLNNNMMSGIIKWLQGDIFAADSLNITCISLSILS